MDEEPRNLSPAEPAPSHWPSGRRWLLCHSLPRSATGGQAHFSAAPVGCAAPARPHSGCNSFPSASERWLSSHLLLLNTVWRGQVGFFCFEVETVSIAVTGGKASTQVFSQEQWTLVGPGEPWGAQGQLLGLVLGCHCPREMPAGFSPHPLGQESVARKPLPTAQVCVSLARASR